MSQLKFLDDGYFRYCTTPRQVEYLTLYLESQSTEVIGEKLNVNPSTVRKSLRALMGRAAQQGYSPHHSMTHTAPDGYKVKGTSTLYDAETGEAKIQWVKTDIDKERQEQLLNEFIDSLIQRLETVKPLPKIPTPKIKNSDLISVYPMGDPHIGLYAWGAETGEDYDCDIAERDLLAAFGYLIEKSPPSEVGLILNLGDFFHSDSSKNTTTKGTDVDVDGRYSRVLEIGMELMIKAVEMALRKHKKVIVRNNRGNHDSESSRALSLAMKYAFKSNDRVEIWPTEKEFFCYQFGQCMFTSCHGDMVKPKDMPMLMATHFPDVWGATQFRYAKQGHIHHFTEKEDNGVITTTYNTLAASDAWHFRSGYLSQRNMFCEVYHRDLGLQEKFQYMIPRDFSKLR